MSSLFVVVNLSIIGNNALLLVFHVHAHERLEDRLVTCADEVRESGTEVARRQLEVVVRNLAEHVVHLVRADRMDDVVYDAVVAVDGRQLAAHEVPLFVGVPRNVHLRVVEECDDDAVAREDEHGYGVVDDERHQSEQQVILVAQV